MRSSSEGTDTAAGDERNPVHARSHAPTNESSVKLRVVPNPRQHLATLYREHVDFVVQVVRQSGIGARDVEDVVHDVFLVVHRRIDEYDTRRPVRPWLYGIARNIVLDHKRRAWRKQRRQLRGLPMSAPEDPELHLQRSRAVGWVQQFMASLAEESRLVFALSEIEGMTAPEISRDLGIKLNTVYSRLRRARKRFRTAVAEANAAEDSSR